MQYFGKHRSFEDIFAGKTVKVSVAFQTREPPAAPDGRTGGRGPGAEARDRGGARGKGAEGVETVLL